MTHWYFGRTRGQYGTSMLAFSRRGFTLVELLVVIGILALLMALLMPAVQSVRSAALHTDCLNRIRQIALATHNFESAFRHLPPGTLGYADVVEWNEYKNSPTPPYWKRVQHTSFLTLILPYMELENLQGSLDSIALSTNRELYDQVDPNKGGPAYEWFADVRGFELLATTPINPYTCPADNINQVAPFLHVAGGSQPVTFGGPNTDRFSFVDWLPR